MALFQPMLTSVSSGVQYSTLQIYVFLEYTIRIDVLLEYNIVHYEYSTLRIDAGTTVCLTWVQTMSANSAGFESIRTPWFKQNNIASRKTGVVLALAMYS